jgi:hypothetical protein
MSYDVERVVITNQINANAFFGFTNFGLDAGDFVENHNSGFMSIIPGQAFVGSIAGDKRLIKSPGVLQVTFLFEGGSDSKESREKAQEIIDAFFELKLDENGKQPTSDSNVIIDFGANGFVPYISELRKEAPFLRTTVNASFLRTEKKSRSN